MNGKMMEIRTELKRQIDRDSRLTPLLLVMTTIALPLIEGILVNIWTSANLAGPAGPCLLVVVLFHLAIGGLLIWHEFKSKSPLRILSDAAELSETHCTTQRELDRRVLCYRMFRDSIETVNNQVCSLQDSPQPFDRMLRPVLKRFLDSICETLGVCSNKYTLEIYLRDDLHFKGQEHPQLCGYRLAFFESPTIPVDVALSMESTHPLCLISGMDRQRMMGRVSADASIFGSGHSQPYFEQYASHMIPTQCATGHLGYVVFTTAQTDPIATDALETVGLLASIISSFYSRWFDCVLQRRQAEQLQQLYAQVQSLSKGKQEAPPRLPAQAATESRRQDDDQAA